MTEIKQTASPRPTASASKPKRRKGWLIVGGVLVALLGLGLWAFGDCSDTVARLDAQLPDDVSVPAAPGDTIQLQDVLSLSF